MNTEIVRLRLAVQSALIGRITSNVRGVFIRIDVKKIYLSVVVDGEDNYWDDIIYEVGADIIADFDDMYNIEEEVIRLDYPICLYFRGWICVYRRYE